MKDGQRLRCIKSDNPVKGYKQPAKGDIDIYDGHDDEPGYTNYIFLVGYDQLDRDGKRNSFNQRFFAPIDESHCAISKNKSICKDLLVDPVIEVLELPIPQTTES